MKIQLLGDVSVVEDGSRLAIGGPKQQAVLAALAIEPRTPVTIDRLSEVVWGDAVPDRARRSLSTYVSNLRRELGDIVQSHASGYSLAIDRSSVDAAHFLDEITDLRTARQDDEVHLPTVRRALELWHGPPLAGIEHHGVLQPEAMALEEAHAWATEEVLRSDVASGSAAAAIPTLERLVEQQPDRERLRGLLMEALYRDGRQKEALEVYRTYERHLREDLGLEPSPELRDLETQILGHQPGPASPAVPDVGLAPVPLRFTELVGRDDLIRQLQERLQTRRLVTVTGAGGIGKSSVASEVATRSIEPVVFIRASDFEERGQWDVVADAMGLAPDPSTTPEAVVSSFSRHRALLMYVDGCEPYRAEVSQIAQELLGIAPELKVLATSRAPLGVAGESVVRVPPLDSDEGFALLLDRADLSESVVSGDEEAHLRAVATALDGHPLSIEITAARLRHLPAAVVAGQLRAPADAPDATLPKALAQTLRASYDPLPADVRRSLRHLSLLRHGFDHSILRHIAGAMTAVEEAVDGSLVERPDQHGWFRILEPIRQFLDHELDEHGEVEEARARIALAYATWCTDFHRAYWSTDHRAAVDSSTRHRRGLASAFAWAVDHDATAADIIMANFLEHAAQMFWSDEFLDAATRATDAASPSPSAETVIGRSAAAYLFDQSGRSKAAIELIESTEQAARRVGDRYALGRVLDRKALILMSSLQIDLNEAIELCEESAELMGSVGAVDYRRALANASAAQIWTRPQSEAQAYIDELDAWFCEVLGEPDLFLQVQRAWLAIENNEFERAVDLARTPLTEQAGSHDLRMLKQLAEQLGVASCYAEAPDDASLAARSMERLIEISGVRYLWDINARIGDIVLGGDSDAGLEEIRRFCTELGLDRPANSQAVDYSGEVIGGTEWASKPFARLVLPMTQILASAERMATAARIATDAPEVLAELDESLFASRTRWLDLQAMLPEPLGRPCRSLSDVFWAIAHEVGVSRA